MKLIIASRGRHDYSPTMDSLPAILKSQVEVWVPKDEIKLYRASPIFKGAKFIAWPSYVDCIPKKRRFLYENVNQDYMVLDDDLKLGIWTGDRYSNPEDYSSRFVKTLEHTFDYFDNHTVVGVTNTFMASKKIKETGKLTNGGVPFCFAGFAKKRPKLDFKTFFFTDIAMPMQILSQDLKIVTDARISYTMRSNQKLATTGTTPYRTDDLIKYSALALALQMPGYVHGLSNTGNNGGGWSLKKTFTRPNLDKGKVWVREFCVENGMVRKPALVDLDLKTPFEDLKRKYKQSWDNARK